MEVVVLSPRVQCEDGSLRRMSDDERAAFAAICARRAERAAEASVRIGRDEKCVYDGKLPDAAELLCTTSP